MRPAARALRQFAARQRALTARRRPRDVRSIAARRLGCGTGYRSVRVCAAAAHRRARRAAPRRAATNPGDVIAPNPNLVVQGIPPIPRSLAEQVGRYNDFAGHRFVDWHPTRREMLVSHRRPGTNTTQIFVVATPLAAPRQLTDCRRAGSHGELRADRRRLHRLRAEHRRRRSGAAAPARPRHLADDAAHRGGAAPRPAALAEPQQPPALPLAAARPHRRRRPPRGGRADAVDHGPGPAANRAASSPSCRAAAGRSPPCRGTTGWRH